MSARRSPGRAQGGQVSAFVVVFMAGLLLIAGLVIDGGIGLAAKRRAIDEAQAAARAGAEAIDVAAYRQSGTVALDPAAATAAALSYLRRTGHEAGARVRVTGDAVVVDERFDQRLNLLGLIGMASITVTGHGSARNVSGIVGEGR